MPAYIVPTIKENCLKKLLIIGKTGTGKSSLCNRIAGFPANADIFPVSSEATSCTQSTQFGNIKFDGNPERIMSLIDTIGFDDPNNDTDVKIIAELVDKLKNSCDYVNLFAIAVNGQAPRLDGSLVAMIKIFEEMFGEQFWNQCVLLFTRVRMDKKEKRMRLKNTGKSDDDIARDYLKVVESKFLKGGSLNYLFLDACYDEEDEEEEAAFKEAMENLYTMVEKAPKLPTSQVNENVESENGKLKRHLAEREKDKEEFNKIIQEMNAKLEEAEKNRAKDEEKYQKIKKEHEDQKIKDMNEKLEEAEKKRAEDEEKYRRLMRKHEEELERMKRESSEKHGPGLFEEICDVLGNLGVVTCNLGRIGRGAQLAKDIWGLF